jgi:hypothetical protein
MFALGAATRVYVATGVTDMRIGFDGLYGKIRDVLECDPTLCGGPRYAADRRCMERFNAGWR